MGKAGAQLSGSRNSAAYAAARRITSAWCCSTPKRRLFPLSSGDSGNIQHAIDAVRSSRLRGGTDLQRALASRTGAGRSARRKQYLSGHSQRRRRDSRAHSELERSPPRMRPQWKQLPETQRPRTYIFAVGDDANLPLFRMLARQDGVLEHVLSTEPIEFKLNSFLSKIGRSPVGQLDLSIAPETAVDTVYPLQATTFSGSLASWVGRYQKPQDNVSFHGSRSARWRTVQNSRQKRICPKSLLDHPQLPRLWARARVDALARKDRARRRRPGHHRRNHPPRAPIQVRHALHVFSGGSARLAATPRDTARRSDPARQDRRIHRLGGCSVSRSDWCNRFAIFRPKTSGRRASSRRPTCRMELTRSA